MKPLLRLPLFNYNGSWSTLCSFVEYETKSLWLKRKCMLDDGVIIPISCYIGLLHGCFDACCYNDVRCTCISVIVFYVEELNLRVALSRMVRQKRLLACVYFSNYWWLHQPLDKWKTEKSWTVNKYKFKSIRPRSVTWTWADKSTQHRAKHWMVTLKYKQTNTIDQSSMEMFLGFKTWPRGQKFIRRTTV